MLLSLLSLLHVLAAVAWVGGMLFAHTCLRPSAALVLEPPQRLSLWVQVFKRFFPLVWGAVLILPITGYSLIFSVWGSFALTPLYVHIMNATGILMIAIYVYLYYVPFKHLKQAVEEKTWPDGGAALVKIRLLVTINLFLGIFVVVVASGGRFF